MCLWFWIGGEGWAAWVSWGGRLGFGLGWSGGESGICYVVLRNDRSIVVVVVGGFGYFFLRSIFVSPY